MTGNEGSQNACPFICQPLMHSLRSQQGSHCCDILAPAVASDWHFDSCCRRSFTSLARLCNWDGACDQLVRGHRSQTHLQSLADAVQSTSSASPWLASSFARAAIKEILELWATPQSQEATIRVLHLIYRVSCTLYAVALRETESGPAAVAVLSLQQRICILSSHRAANLPFTTTHNSEV